MLIRDLEVLDLRFPTSRTNAGTDAMHPDPDYSAAYVVLKTDSQFQGHGLTFTIGRGNEICAAAIRAFQHHIVGRRLADLTADQAGFWRELAQDSQLRWLGPEKGVIHISMAAIINAVWDLWAKSEGKPVWKLLADMTPRQIVSCIDFAYITDALTPDEALEILERHERTRAKREAELTAAGYPAYTTSAGWIGYSDDGVRTLVREALAAGWTHFKVKVGGHPDDDRRRVGLVRAEIGPGRTLMIDANQRWDVGEATERVRALGEFRPLWIEEPTSPDDVLGHAAIAKAIRPIGVATGEHCANRVLFKQLMQADAISFCQIDSCRLGGVNENLAVILMAAKFGVPVCPHAGGVGLCEMVQHLSMFDYIAVSASLENRVTEFVDHLHEHFIDPVVIRNARYMPPARPGYGTAILPESRLAYRYPEGPVWSDSAAEV
ncbi:MAG TPA: L-fuconate dehydratase [Vicinamibacterales bacterium]|jgi:L-fuconate dehydratase|nr:L-fuconate dehydratase [Vicinamibacterales bacterium]